MKYQVIFRIEKEGLIDKLIHKIENLRNYMEDEGNECEIEVVFAGPVVNYFKGDYSDLTDLNVDLVVCKNALNTEDMETINEGNVRTVAAGIGEIVEKKADGWIEYTIE